MAETLKEKTTKGIIWSFIDKFGQQIIYLISGIILARILTPNDYGLVGGIAIFIALASILTDSGFSRTLINKQVVRQEEYSTVFYFNLVISLIIYTLLFLCAPFIAGFYKEPRLILIVRVHGLIVVFNAISIIQNVLLAKKLDFKSQARYALVALTFSTLIALTLAYRQMGVWALVAQPFFFFLIKSLLLWGFSDWRPGLVFRWHIIKNLFAFANKLIAASLINAFFNYIYYPIIGYFFNVSQLGYYVQANRYHEIPSNLVSNTFRAVVAPVFAEVKEDNVRLKRVLSKNIQLISFIIFPVMCVFITIAEPFFLVLFKEKWLPSVPLFQVLCIGGMFTPFGFIMNELFIAKERSDIYLGIEIAKKAILVGLIMALFYFGLIGLAASWSIYAFIALLIYLYYTSGTIEYTFWNFIKDSLGYFLISVVTCGIAGYISRYIPNNYFLILFNVFFVGIIYILVCYLCRLEACREVFTRVLNKKVV